MSVAGGRHGVAAYAGIPEIPAGAFGIRRDGGQVDGGGALGLELGLGCIEITGITAW